MDKIDFFICHASEDKEDFVRSLAQHLMRCGAVVFYDEFSIKLGDSLTEKINEGLRSSNAGVIVLSKFYFEKSWTNAELQAIFNKATNDDYKLLIVYHGITNDAVRERYPLLADIKATNSEKGFEKVTEELFEAIGLNARIGYGTVPYSEDGGVDRSDGFNISLRLAIPIFGDPRIDKVVFESGNAEYRHSRIRFVVKWNKRIYFEITCADFQLFGLSADIADWKTEESHFVLGNYDDVNKELFLMIDGVVVDRADASHLSLPVSFFDKGRGIIGCSLELDQFAPFRLTHFALGKALSTSQATAMFEAVEKFNKTLGR